jgi:predicted nucleic acid-binding protein
VNRVVIDASVAAKWFIPEELSTEARSLLTAEYQFLAPDLLWAELGSILWKKHRRQEIDKRTATRVLRDFSRVPIEFHASERSVEAALELAIGHGVTVYDGLYLALAASQGCHVVTGDRGLYQAPHRHKTHLVEWLGELR